MSQTHVAGIATRVRDPVPPATAVPPAIVLEMKLHAAPLRAGLLPRGELLATGHSHVVVTAPPGYGKTTALAQYAATATRPIAWVSLDEADDDPVLLLRELAASLSRIAPVHPAVFRNLNGADPAIARVVLPGLVNALGAAPGAALILDDLHLVQDERSIAIVAFLCEHVPAGARIVVASRRVSRLPLARPRARGDLLEVAAPDLALTPAEVDGLLQAADVTLEARALEAILARAEGWPAVLGVGVRRRSRTGRFGGDDRGHRRGQPVPVAARPRPPLVPVPSPLPRRPAR